MMILGIMRVISVMLYFFLMYVIIFVFLNVDDICLNVGFELKWRFFSFF